MANATQHDGTQCIEGVGESFMRFLRTYSPPNYEAPEMDQNTTEENLPSSYVARTVQEMASDNDTVLYVDYKHLADFDYDMADKIVQHFERCDYVLRDGLKAYIRQFHEQYIRDAHGPEKEFFVGIFGLHSTERLRDLRTEHIGKLSSFSGTVTRTSDVRPELFLGTFRCQHCGSTVSNVEQFYKFTEPMICPQRTCNNR
jgi:DNA replication licensing factor MCM6